MDWSHVDYSNVFIRVWTLILMAPIHCKFLQICSDEERISSPSWMAWGRVHSHFWVNYQKLRFCVPQIVSLTGLEWHAGEKWHKRHVLIISELDQITANDNLEAVHIIHGSVVVVKVIERQTDRRRRKKHMQAAKKSTDSECDALISITWILEFINGALVYWVLLLDMTRRKGLKKETNMTEWEKQNWNKDNKKQKSLRFWPIQYRWHKTMHYKACNQFILFLASKRPFNKILKTYSSYCTLVFCCEIFNDF